MSSLRSATAARARHCAGQTPSRKNRSVARSAKLRIMRHMRYVSPYSQVESAHAGGLSPPPVQPQPLLRVLAHPALDDARDQLHRALNVDLAFRVAWQVERVGELAPETIAVREPYGADAAHRAIGVTRKLR